MNKVIFLFFLVLNSILLYSQTRAVRTNIKPKIDGVLEEVWQNASKFTSFKQVEPEILANATIRTEAYFLYDEENLYIAVKSFQDMKTIRSSNARKDADIVWESDYVTFSVDPLDNFAQAFFFTVNAANAVGDGFADEGGVTYTEWDGIFFSAARISNDYWTVEMRIPLSTLNFQDKEVQDWNVTFYRHYSQNQEIDASSLVDVNGPYRLTNYNKLTGLTGLEKTFKFRITPYIYSHDKDDFLSGSNDIKGKAGGEVRYSPSSSMTILATFNPDYAQIETDKEVINVTDLPTEYPEKRPFFIESSDFYPGAAVNTRNIVDIKAGVKVRKLGDLLKYDVTGVLDGDNNQWLLSNIKLSESNSYIAEVIGGIKNQKSRYDYNVTTHLQKWFLDKRISLSNWVGTINSPVRGYNEWEVFTGAGWNTRNFAVSFSNHIKSKFYNPNIVGWNYLSNLNKYTLSIRYSIINESGFFRTVNFKSTSVLYDLVTPAGNSYLDNGISIESFLHLNDYLGNWSLNFYYYPPITQKFRYRNIEGYDNKLIYEDEISRFVLVDDKFSSISLELISDNSKNIGFSLFFDNSHVRKSKANLVSSEVYWKITPTSFVKYSLDFINIIGSDFQDKFEQIIHRIHMEYNITDKINIRAIIQPNTWKMPESNNLKNISSAYNLTLSWQYMPGSFIYFVYSNYKNSTGSDVAPETVTNSGHTFVLKINKSFSF